MDKKETDGKYNRRAHSVCCLTYHAVFVIKYRRKVIDNEIMEFMKNHTRYLIEDRFKGKMLEFNGEEDHIHILFELPPSAAPSVIAVSYTHLLLRPQSHCQNLGLPEAGLHV